MKKDQYHHGNLSNALIEKAVESLAENNELPSLRSLAKMSGVSPAAVYRHFQNKEQMIAAVAEFGFDILEKRFRNCIENSDDLVSPVRARENFVALGEAYIQFAIEYPELFRICFGKEASTYRKRGPGESRISTLIYLYQVVDGLHVSGLINSPANDQKVAITWSLIHGLVNLTEAGVDTASMCMGNNPREKAEKLADIIIQQFSN
jgi:AcrR family transcriptional regulator